MSELAQTSIYLTAEDREIVAHLQEEMGLSRSAVIRVAVRRMYEAKDRDRRKELLRIADELRRMA